MVAYTFRMPAGIPGDLNRAFQPTVTSEVMTPLGTTGHPTAYGIPVAIDAGTFQVRALAAGDTLANLKGFLVRPFPITSGNPGDPVGVATPPNSGACDVMLRGWMSVKLSGAVAAVKEGPVYIWTAAPSGSHITGGLEAANPGGSGFQVTNATFRGPADANGITEIAFNI